MSSIISDPIKITPTNINISIISADKTTNPTIAEYINYIPISTSSNSLMGRISPIFGSRPSTPVEDKPKSSSVYFYRNKFILSHDTISKDVLLDYHHNITTNNTIQLSANKIIFNIYTNPNTVHENPIISSNLDCWIL